MRSGINKSGRTVLYIDPFSGVSGDMLLGAFLAIGVPKEVISGAVEAVIPGEVELEAGPVTRSGLGGMFCKVNIIGGPESRTLEEMTALVKGSGLSEPVIQSALRALQSLGEAERKAHGQPDGPVHLHELGGQDTLADIVGTLAAVQHINPCEVRCGPVNLGRGYVRTSHGRMPVPAPATSYLVEGMKVISEGPEAELTTPTGAAVLREIVDRFGVMGPMTVSFSGNGAGSRDFARFPNLLRLFVGETEEQSVEQDAVIIECGIDDVSPEYLASATEALQAAGAREVHLIPAHTKKGRIGILLRVLASVADRQPLMDAVLEATGSAGLRFWEVGRLIQERAEVLVDTVHGPVSFKRWRTPSGQWRFKPEYEDVRRLAESAGIPAAGMRDIAIASYMSEVGDGQEED